MRFYKSKEGRRGAAGVFYMAAGSAERDERTAGGTGDREAGGEKNNAGGKGKVGKARQ